MEMEVSDPRHTVGGEGSTHNQKPVPMKLFSTWDIEKSSPSCIPRICALSLSRITIEKPIENEPHDIIVALKMLVSKRTLRSNEIFVPKSGILDVELDLTFSLQYSHSMKRGNNQLQVLLQRRKKYRNRTMLGYRTLAIATIDLMDVLQHSNDREILLYAVDKPHEMVGSVAKLTLLSFTTQALDLEEARVGKEGFSFTEDEDDLASSSQDDTSDLDYPQTPHRKSASLPISAHTRQKNLKQKFVALLRRFKLSDDVLESAVREIDINSRAVDDIFDDVENLSDSIPDDEDDDNFSIRSNAKPQLKPFFDGRINSINESSNFYDSEAKSNKLEIDFSPKKKVKTSINDLIKAMPSLADAECLIFAQANDSFTVPLREMLQSPNHPFIVTNNQSEIKSFINSAFVKAQQMKNLSSSTSSAAPSSTSTSSSSSQLKLALLGTEAYIGSFVRLVVEHFASKLLDLLHYVRFFIIPLGSGAINKNLSRMDQKFAALFRDAIWKENTSESKLDSTKPNQHIDFSEIASRILRYITKANQLIQFPFAEVIIANKDKNNGDSSQMVLPFLGEVRLGPMELESGDIEETALSGSPPNLSNSFQFGSPPNTTLELPTDLIDLQVDYWMLPSKLEPSSLVPDRLQIKKEVKCTLKSAFKSIQIYKGVRQASMYGESLGKDSLKDLNAGLTMVVVTKEKKQKIMRLGKKAKETEYSKIDGVSRLICTSKSQDHLLTVNIDGTEWTSVKFFQVSAQWQTHFKYLPVLLFSTNLD